MAHIEKRGPGRWRARYRGPDGRERSRTFDRKVDADRWLDQVRGDLARGTYIDPTEAKVMFKDYAETWRAAQVHRGSTSDATETNLRRHIYPTFGSRSVGTIRPTEVQAWVRHLSDELAPATVAGCYRLLSTVLKAAVADRILPASPCVGIRLPKAPKRRIEPLPVEAVAAIQLELPERARAAVTLAAGAGLRQGEVFGLTVDRIDFLRRQLTVDRQLVTPQKGDPRLGPPKTEASNRTIPLPRLVVDCLAEHLARWPATHDWGLVFTNALGEPWRRNRFAETWRAACQRTARGEENVTGWPEANFHDLRHHHASLLIAAGCSVKVVQAQLGHANASETLDTYSHLWPDDNDRVRDAIDRAFEIQDNGTEATGTEQA